MKTIQYLAAGLLLFTGALHVAQMAVMPLDAVLIVTVIFGIAYLAIGVFVLRDSRTAYYAGAIVPLIGLALASLNMATTPTLLGALFMATDVVVIGCCVYLLLKVRPGAHVHR